MTKADADKKYTDNWLIYEPSLECLLARIDVLASHGGHEIHVQYDSNENMAYAIKKLREAGFSPEFYNGEKDIIHIEWGC